MPVGCLITTELCCIVSLHPIFKLRRVLWPQHRSHIWMLLMRYYLCKPHNLATDGKIILEK